MFSAARFWSVRLLSILLVVVLAIGLQTFVVPHLGIYDVRLLVLSMLFASLAVSLNLINGITGQFSMGHAAFYLIGAYTGAKLTNTFFAAQTLSGPIWLLLMVLVGGLAAALVGFIVGLPSLRLRGDYLAIVTLGFGEIARVIVNNQDGSKSSIAGLDLGGSYAMNVSQKLTEVAYVAILLVFTIAVARNLLKTAHGLTFLSVREDELAAEATGVNTTKVKVLAFVVGAALAGMAGVLFAHYNGTVAPDDFKMDVSFIIVTMVVIGGTGSITGAAVAGVTLKLLEEGLRNLPPVPAINLLAFVLASIAIFVTYQRINRKTSLVENKSIAALLSVFGVLGSIGLLYAMYPLWISNFSIILKIAGIAILLIAAMTILLSRYRSVALPRFGLLSLSLCIIFALRFPLIALLHAVPTVENALKATTYTGNDLRWVFFAVALVVTMLIRSQGIFGHHEFSWDFVSKLFGGKHRETAVSA